MTAAEWMESTYKIMQGQSNIRPILFCKDGTYLSLQGSGCHYSTPRSFTSKYQSVEVGIGDKDGDPELDKKYFGEPMYSYSGDVEYQEREDPCDIQSAYEKWMVKIPNPFEIRYIYGNVDMEDVEKLVERHGGIL